MPIKSIRFNDLQHSTDHYWTSLDMAEVDALSAKNQKASFGALFSFRPLKWHGALSAPPSRLAKCRERWDQTRRFVAKRV